MDVAQSNDVLSGSDTFQGRVRFWNEHSSALKNSFGRLPDQRDTPNGYFSSGAEMEAMQVLTDLQGFGN